MLARKTLASKILGGIAALMPLVLPLPAEAQLRGHGGPVRALAVSQDGKTAMSGSFDQSAILWDLDRGAALQVLRFHDGAVNALAALPDGRFVTGGEDGRLAVWRAGASAPAQVFEAHKAPIAGLAVSPAGESVASASWDGAVRITSLADGRARVLQGHQGNVNAVAFLPDGRLASAGYDATLRLWPKDEGAAVVVSLPTPLNVVAAAPDGEIVAAGADGIVRILDRRHEVRATVETTGSPIIGLALSADGRRVAAAAIAGSVAVIDRAEGRALFSLVGPGLPVWSVAFRETAGELLTGGSDRLVRRWDAASGEPIGAVAMARPDDLLAGFTGERGAELFQACAACHTLTPDGGNRAGPTLHGIFGRRIATAPGYNYSEALKQLNIVWNGETIAKLFEVGPAQYTPGTKMPEQHITNAADREALVRFLEKATTNRDAKNALPP
jgi:cytochrome c